MKLSRLTNRQLRRLLAKGEVRFAFDSQKAFSALSKDFKEGEARLERAMKTLEKISKGSPAEGMRKQATAMAMELSKALNYIDKVSRMGSNII